MKYALLGYDRDESLKALGAEKNRALHRAHHAFDPPSNVRVVAHYRFRPARLTTTLQRSDAGLARAEGPSHEGSNGLRALYLLESDDPSAVVEFATQLPAVQMGGTVEVWPLIDTDRNHPQERP
jgi:hypothetical protein